MDPRMLRYYSQELSYMREMGAEFAGQFPTPAGARARTLERLLRLANGPSNIEQNEPNAVEGGSLHSRRSR